MVHIYCKFQSLHSNFVLRQDIQQQTIMAVTITENKELVRLGKEASKSSSFVIYPPKEKKVKQVKKTEGPKVRNK